MVKNASIPFLFKPFPKTRVHSGNPIVMETIKHLYWRAGFGLSPAEWAEKKPMPLRKAVDELFSQARKPALLPVPELDLPSEPRMLDREQIQERQRMERQRVLESNFSWLQRMANPQEPALLERMTLFWHGHFACDIDNSVLAVQYLNTLRSHALGKFRDLVVAIAREPAMIRYLNNQQNRKDQPNENFARELLELFTIGRGNYTETDIKEGARAFTGWSSTLRGEYIFRPGQHDYDRKTFFGKTGNFDGTDIIDLILERKETALFIVKKIYRYFVNETGPEERIHALALEFYASGYDISRLMQTIFGSDWFYLPENMGNKIKSPVELLAGMIRSLGLQFEDGLGAVFIQRALGQVLFHPPNVAGWPGGKSWIDNSTLMTRLNLPTIFLASAEANLRPKDDLTVKERSAGLRRLKATYDLQPFSRLIRQNDPEAALNSLREYLLQKESAVDNATIRQYIQATEPGAFLAQSIMRIMSLPEYQMC